MQSEKAAFFLIAILAIFSICLGMISGCYHNVSDEHLQAYIDETCFRWNTRKASQSERFSDMFNKSIGLIVTWNELKLCKVA